MFSLLIRFTASIERSRDILGKFVSKWLLLKRYDTRGNSLRNTVGEALQKLYGALRECIPFGILTRKPTALPTMNLQIAFLFQNLNRNRVPVAHARSRIGAMRR